MSIPLSFGVSLVDTAGVFSGTGTKTIGTTPSDALIHFVVTDVISAGMGTTRFVDGKINAVPINSLPGYDFSHLINGSVVITFVETGTDWNTVIGHPGISVNNAGLS